MNELIEDTNKMISETLSTGEGITGALASAFSAGAAFMGNMLHNGSCSFSEIQMAWREVLRSALIQAFGETETTKLGEIQIEVN